jgi:ribonuclease R
MSAPSGEILTESWYPSREELLKRPKFTGALAIDPKHPYEIDDAIFVLPGTDGSFEAQVHVSDGGLLADTDLLAVARDNGWSMYHEDGSADLMLPPDSGVKALDLTAKSALGVPAVTIGFGFSPTSGIGDISITKSRTRSDGMTYTSFRRQYDRGGLRAQEIADAAQALATHTELESLSRERFAEDVVGRFMVIANFIVAGEMEREDVPWLFRNHSKDAYDRLRGRDDRLLFEEMRVALYGATALQHEGLGLKRYCHFTSPLRRFADLANHLNLSAYLGGEEPPYTYLDIDDIAAELTELYARRSRHFKVSANSAA